MVIHSKHFSFRFISIFPMELRFLISTLSDPLAFSHWGLMCRRAKTFNCFVVLLWTFFCLSAYVSCSTYVWPNLPEYGACEFSGTNCNLADLNLQTSYGDFVNEAKGRGSESPFGNHVSSASSFVTVIQVSDSVTHVGIINCGHMDTDFHDMSLKVSNLQENCRIVILTNETASSEVAIPCEDALHICFEQQRLSFVGIIDKTKFVSSGSMRAGYVVRNMGLPPNVKVLETSNVDELVFGNLVPRGTTNAMSVLEDNEVLFPMVQVGSYLSRRITVKNPSNHPVTMQLILNTEEMIDECRGPDGLLHSFSSGNLVIDEVISPAKYGFSLPESAVTEAYVQPYDYATLGPIIFYPSKRCRWNGSALIKNNISGVELIPLRGTGGLLSLAILERSEHVQSINFDLKMHNILGFSLPYALLRMKDTIFACSHPLVKELYAKNTGDLPLEVKTMRVSGRECRSDGFKIHDCKGFALEPGESIKFLISYQTDFSAARVHRDLELALASGIFLIPMKASVPYDVLCNCKKFVFWMRVKKWFLGFILVASLYFMMFGFTYPQTSFDYLCKNDHKSIHITLKHAGKTPLLPRNHRKDKLSMSGKMTDMFYSVGKGTNSVMPATCVGYSYDLSETSDQEVSQISQMKDSENHKQISFLLDTQKEGKSPTTSIQSSDVKPSQQGELKIKKEKVRRRKKKSAGAKLTAVSEVSSSRSGNSTPSSSPPSSPLIAASTKSNRWSLSSDVEQPRIPTRSITTHEAAQYPKKSEASSSAAKTNILKHRDPIKCISNNVSSPKVSHSPSRSDASKPLKMFCGASPMPGGHSLISLVSTSSASLSCRAPGSKLDNQKAVLAPKAEIAEEYTYDIWGDHLSGLHLLVPKDVTCMKSSPAEKNFNSFFVWDPQAIK